jgi:hypothetical protein
MPSRTERSLSNSAEAEADILATPKGRSYVVSQAEVRRRNC